MSGKIAENQDAAWEMQETYEGKPHGWIQWKGTGVCMDVHCACGYHSHVDADFAYNVKCPKCHRVYMCNGHIELIELQELPKTCVVPAKSHDDYSYLDNWQQIDSAPRNGTIIPCTSWGSDQWHRLHWKTNPRIVEGKKHGQFARHAESYFGDPNEMDDYELALPENQPTHWFPLPELS